MVCNSCKYWKPTYAPYVLHGYPYIMTCHKEDKEKSTFEEKRCKYWESAKEDNNVDQT